MKKIGLFLAIVCFTSIAFSQNKVAKISFETEVIDYGTIAVNSDGIRIFEFTNTGNMPLVIAEVSSSCGCTIPKKPEAPILPGDKGAIQVKYNTAILGPIRKAITVKSNADTPTKILTIKGMVEKPE